MSIRSDRWRSPASKGNVAGAVVITSAALNSLVSALEDIQAGKEISVQLRVIREKQDELTKLFDELTGWEPE